MLDELRSMAIFARTVEIGSLRGAGQALGLSPSVVSHHLAQLEARLGVALLYRTTRKLALTAEGETLFAAAKAMIAAAEGGLSDLRAGSANPSGRLAVAAPAALIAGALLDDLAAFGRTFPRVALAISFSDVSVDLLRDGIDVAIRAGTLKDSALKTRRLFSMRRVLVAAPVYVASRAAPRGPSDVESWDWIKLKSRPPRTRFTDASGGEHTVEITTRLVVDSAAAMLAFASRGLGLATVPVELAEPELASGRVVEVLPAFRLESLGVYAVWPANAPSTSLGARLVSFLEQRRRSSP